MIEAPTTVAIVEDIPLFRALLAGFVDSAPELELVAACESVADARRRLRPGIADVVLMDIALPDGNGFGLARTLRRADPALGVVLLSSHDMMDVLLALPDDERVGWSYLSKNSAASPAVLLRALRASASGRSVLDPALLARLTPRRDSPLAQLSARQLDALRLLASGMSNSAIARTMGIAAHSVDNLLNSVYAALGVRGDSEANSRVSAALIMIEHGALLREAM